MTRFSAAIFDLDGTLIDTERLLIDTCLETLADHGHRVPRSFILSMLGMSGVEGAQRLSAFLDDRIDMAAFEAAWSAATDLRYAQGIAPMAGAQDLLADLANRNLPRAVATNSATASAVKKLGMAGLTHHFNPGHIVGYDAVPAAKPAPDVFLAAAARLGVAPERCVAFEDSDTGVSAALAAGMVVVHIPDLAHTGPNGAQYRAATLLAGARVCGLID